MSNVQNLRCLMAPEWSFPGLDYPMEIVQWHHLQTGIPVVKSHMGVPELLDGLLGKIILKLII